MSCQAAGMRTSLLLLLLLPAAAQAEPRRGGYVAGRAGGHTESATYGDDRLGGFGGTFDVAFGYGIANDLAIAIEGGVVGMTGKQRGIASTWHLWKGLSGGLMVDWFFARIWHVFAGAGWMARDFGTVNEDYPSSNIQDVSGPYGRIGIGVQNMLSPTFGIGAFLRLETAYATAPDARYTPIGVTFGAEALSF
jgi:hypothetical protein